MIGARFSFQNTHKHHSKSMEGVRVMEATLTPFFISPILVQQTLDSLIRRALACRSRNEKAAPRMRKLRQE